MEIAIPIIGAVVGGIILIVLADLLHLREVRHHEGAAQDIAEQTLKQASFDATANDNATKLVG
jgi:hypothetical protein